MSEKIFLSSVGGLSSNDFCILCTVKSCEVQESPWRKPDWQTEKFNFDQILKHWREYYLFKCLNKSPYSDQIRENTDEKKTSYLKIFNAACWFSLLLSAIY